MADSCLRFLVGEVEVAAVVKIGGRSIIYVDMVWSTHRLQKWVLLIRLQTLILNCNGITRFGLLSIHLSYLCYFSFILPNLLALELGSCIAIVFKIYVAMVQHKVRLFALEDVMDLAEMIRLCNVLEQGAIVNEEHALSFTDENGLVLWQIPLHNCNGRV